MKGLLLLNIIFSLLPLTIAAEISLEESPASFILWSKQIYLSEYPDAFNPSIVRWKGKLLMSFRNIANPKDSYNSSEIGLVWLDRDFQPITTPQILQLSKEGTSLPKRAEDARLIDVDGHLFMIYSDNEDLEISKKGFRVYVAELDENNGTFFVISKERLLHFEGENQGLREKNWTPFEYLGNLFLSYSVSPHLVFRPLLGTSVCETFSRTDKKILWPWGTLRGGTQMLKIGDRYLTFFHSSVRMISEHSQGKEMLHYFMGACIFEAEPPFAMTHISPSPIIGCGFFSGPIYQPYWGSWRGIFPGGFVLDNDYIWIVYGRQNHELWVVKIDTKEMLQSLIPLSE